MASGIEDEISEREFLGSFVHKQIKYGSTSSHTMMPQKFKVHNVEPGDTLQGLSLRYGVPMELIKRVNKLWTHDSLSLRPTLNIPVKSQSSEFITPMDSPSSSLASTPSNSQTNIGPLKNGRRQGSSGTDGDEVSLNSPRDSFGINSGDSKTENSKPEETIVDFLSRIDCSISQSKNQVMQAEGKLSATNSTNDLFDLSSITVRPSSSTFMRRQNSTGSTNNGYKQLNGSSPSLTNGDDCPQTLVMTKTRKVKSSLKRLQQEQDELFEL